MNLLLAIDETDSSLKAIRFVGQVFGGRAPDDLRVTVMHVVESLPDYLVHRRADPAAPEAYRHVAADLEAERKAGGERLLADRKQLLLDAGLPPAAVETRLIVKESLPEARKVVAALAIIEEMRQGPHTVVCLGRRGNSAAQSVFPGSVAEKVLRQAAGKTVWIVD